MLETRVLKRVGKKVVVIIKVHTFGVRRLEFRFVWPFASSAA